MRHTAVSVEESVHFITETTGECTGIFRVCFASRAAALVNGDQTQALCLVTHGIGEVKRKRDSKEDVRGPFGPRTRHHLVQSMHLLYQTGFLEVLCSAVMQRGGEAVFYHFLFFENAKGRMELLEIVKILKY